MSRDDERAVSSLGEQERQERRNDGREEPGDVFAAMKELVVPRLPLQLLDRSEPMAIIWWRTPSQELGRMIRRSTVPTMMP